MAATRRGIDSTNFWKRSTGMTCQVLHKSVHNSPSGACERYNCLAGKLQYRVDNRTAKRIEVITQQLYAPNCIEGVPTWFSGFMIYEPDAIFSAYRQNRDLSLHATRFQSSTFQSLCSLAQARRAARCIRRSNKCCRKLVEGEGTRCRNSSLSPPLPSPTGPALRMAYFGLLRSAKRDDATTNSISELPPLIAQSPTMDTDPPLTDADICARMRELRQDVLPARRIRPLPRIQPWPSPDRRSLPTQGADRQTRSEPARNEGSSSSAKKGELASFSVCPVPSCQFHAAVTSPEKIKSIDTLISDCYTNEIPLYLPDLASNSVKTTTELSPPLAEKGEQYFALNPVLNKPQKIVIKGLPINTDIEEIRQDLTSRGFKVIKVAQFNKSKSKKNETPIFMVEIENPRIPQTSSNLRPVATSPLK
ncbi:hypothetical protein TNCV_758081 [Trichonephila clavipes]|nr:hypothetical protein TNCV_758081 [Trichonephila clavipes]